jgi:serine hydrolase
MTFQSKIFIVPGLGNSEENHWQTNWEKQFGFTRIIQQDWDTPHCDEWIQTIQHAVSDYNQKEVILVGHSLACTTIAWWAKKYNMTIKGALLVAPSDTEADTYPPGTTGFTPIPFFTLPFRSIVIASSDDYYVRVERAQLFAEKWGSAFYNIGNAGHVNVASGHSQWEDGLGYLVQLDRQ